MGLGADHLAHQGEDGHQAVFLGEFLEVAAAGGAAHFVLEGGVGAALGGQVGEEVGIYPVAGDVGYEVSHGHFGEFADHTDVGDAFDALVEAAFH